MKMLVSAGNSFTNWIRILAENKFKVAPKYIPRALLVTFLTMLLSPLGMLEKLIYGNKIKKTKVKSPLFIIGHMRSGTTFMHYLTCQDPRYAYITTSETVFPNIFLTQKWLTDSLIGMTLPPKRPMDNMGVSIHSPQEEEFGIANMIPYSPNNGSYFPKHLQKFYEKYSHFEGASPKILQKWKASYLYLMQKITLKAKGKPVISKNLINSSRIEHLLNMFPDAKFIFIYRNPYDVFLSTKKMYKNFVFDCMNFHTITDEELDRTILTLAKKGFRTYLDKRSLIKKGNLVEVRFEEFVKNPVENLKDIYKKLHLDGFEEARPHFEKFASGYAEYKQQKYNIDQKLKERIYSSLDFVFEEFKYSR